MLELAVREADFKAADSLDRKMHERVETLLSFRAGMAFTSPDSSGRAGIIEEVRRSKRFEPNAVGWTLMDLDELDAAEQVLRMGLDPHRPEPLRRVIPLRMLQLELRRGRWRAAMQQQAIVQRQSDPSNAPTPAEAALHAALPFLPVPRADMEAARAQVAESDSVPGSDANDPVGMLRAHKRLYLMAVLSARMEEYATALTLAKRLETLPATPALRPVVTSLAHGVRAAVAWQQQQPEAALAALKNVTAEIPLSVMSDPVFAQERERYIRAEALYQLGRENEALPWYQNGFDGTEHGMLYRAACYLRIGQIAEKQGDKERAAQYYARFLRLWSAPDPELQPLVRSARTRLAALADQ